MLVVAPYIDNQFTAYRSGHGNFTAVVFHKILSTNLSVEDLGKGNANGSPNRVSKGSQHQCRPDHGWPSARCCHCHCSAWAPNSSIAGGQQRLYGILFVTNFQAGFGPYVFRIILHEVSLSNMHCTWSEYKELTAKIWLLCFQESASSTRKRAVGC